MILDREYLEHFLTIIILFIESKVISIQVLN